MSESAARHELLARIRGALGADRRSETREAEYATIERSYRSSAVLDPEARVALFTERLHDYGSTVHRCTEPELPAVIAGILTGHGKQGLLVPAALPESWLPTGFAFGRWASGIGPWESDPTHATAQSPVPDAQAGSYYRLDASEGVLTGCALAIALTGTIIVRHGPGEGTRALTLIPDYHLCVVRLSQLVETVPEGIRTLAGFDPVPVTTISGSSATADIEMIRVKGVHGPRTLEVILIEA